MESRWERGWIEPVHAAEVVWEPMQGENWPVGAELQVLSHDAASGALTGIVRLPQGYRRGPGAHEGETEYYIQSGDLRIGDALRGRGYYEYNPPGTQQPAWTCDAGAELLFLARTGTPDFLPGESTAETASAARLDTEAMPWQVTPVEGPPPGICVKMLRMVEETGEFAALVSNVPRFDYPKLEFHDCIEEIYCLSGDIWLGNSGTLHPGSYIWRPPYITHGPFYSETGCLFYLWCDETLINHFVDDPRLTPEENRRAIETGASTGGS